MLKSVPTIVGALLVFAAVTSCIPKDVTPTRTPTPDPSRFVGCSTWPDGCPLQTGQQPAPSGS